MISIGVDVSSDSSTICAIKADSIVWNSFEVKHNNPDLSNLVDKINLLEDDVKIIMEATGKYHLPILYFLKENGFFVSVINPKHMKDFSKGLSLRSKKTDKIDAHNIAKFGIINRNDLLNYRSDGKVYEDIKQLNREYQHYSFMRINQINYLDDTINQVFPGIRKILRHDHADFSKDKLIDFIERFPHMDFVIKYTLEDFTNEYNKWAKEKGYYPSNDKANEIYRLAVESIPSVSSDNSLVLSNVSNAIQSLRYFNSTLHSILTQMKELCEETIEYEVAMEFDGISTRLAVQLVAEVGNIDKFKDKKSLISYSGIDPHVYQSGKHEAKSMRISKTGSSILRKIGYIIMMSIKATKKPNDEIYKYMLKKESEGKPKKVCKIAGLNKFFRMYYARVKERKAIVLAAKN